MNVFDALADGDILKYSEIEKIEYNVVYLKLHMNKAKILYQRKLKSVFETKAKEEAKKKQRKF